MRKFIPLFALLSLSFLIVSCQNDTATKKATDNLGLDADPKAVAISNAAEEELPEDGGNTELVDENGNVESTVEPELIEFYVEEKKKERKEDKTVEKEKTEDKKSDTKVAVNTKPSEAKPAKKKPIAKKKRGKLSFETDVFKFGTIKPGAVIEHKFEFTNTGDADLVIKDAQVTCGCTHPSYPFIPIKPGEKGYIGVRYDSKGKLGSQKPTVTLTTNGSPATKKIYLEGLVIGEMAKQ